MTLAQGRDVSDYQPVQRPDQWGSFGFAKVSEGLSWTAKTFPGNWASMSKAGVPRGAYHFLHPAQDPVAQARRFVALVRAQGLQRGDMLVVDSELMAGIARSSRRSHTGISLERSRAMFGSSPSPSAAALVDLATKAFLDECARLINPRWHPLITYTMHAVGQYLHQTAAAHPLLWFAWPSQTATWPSAALIAPFKHARFWQYGIVQNIDRDKFSGTAAGLRNWISEYEKSGPFRHVADGTQTLSQIAAGRHTDAEHLLTVSAGAYTPGDIADATALRLPKGLPYYTSHP